MLSVDLIDRVKSSYNQGGLAGVTRDTLQYTASNLSLAYAKIKSRITGGQYNYHGVLVSLRGLEPMVQRSLANDNYEIGAMSNVDDYVLPNSNIVEFGAGLGVLSCYINTRVNNDVTHIALEPNPTIIEKLKETRQTNHAGFEIEEAAYSPADEPVELTMEGPFWGASTAVSSNTTASVEDMSLRRLVNKYGLSSFVLTSNIEGGEYQLLYNELEILKRKCKIMLIGFHDIEEYSLEDTIDMLEDHGFNLVDVSGNKKYVLINTNIHEI